MNKTDNRSGIFTPPTVRPLTPVASLSAAPFPAFTFTLQAAVYSFHICTSQVKY